LRFDEVTPLLQDAYWGHADELDNRALLDAHLRQYSNASYSLQHVVEQASYLQSRNIGLEHLSVHLEIIGHFQLSAHKRQLPSSWVSAFAELLDSIGWVKTRPLSSYEYQTQQSFQKRLIELSSLDSLLGSVTASEALQKLAELCSAGMFQPEAVGDTHIQLLGLLETPALQLDAIWMLNMNDQHWPPPVRMNPLLPAELQRQRGLPNSCAQVQSAFAALVHTRLLNSAPELVFSYALKEDERELRPSPLLNPQDVHVNALPALVPTLAETLAWPATLDMLDDSIAPAISPDEKVRGGVNLFATQAICPAWAFYQYRLGARKLETPVDGLDNMSRGSLLHKVLQYFWSFCSDSMTLKAMSPPQCLAAIDRAIEHAIQSLHEEISFRLPTQVLKIERQRLSVLMQYWLSLEAERSDFVVEACEKQYLVELDGIKLNLTIDRIDRLANDQDGNGLVVIDYKTGSQVSHRSWADDRITEPQLPIYAALALQGEEVVAVCLAKIRSDESKFIGIADAEFVPGINVLSQLRADSAFKRFNDWNSLKQHWHTSLTKIAQELRSGVASVTFAKESDLEYCDVKPLLRLPERLLQYESQHIGQAAPSESDAYAG
jgi:exodeoxyribonuclease-5